MIDKLGINIIKYKNLLNKLFGLDKFKKKKLYVVFNTQ